MKNKLNMKTKKAKKGRKVSDIYFSYLTNITSVELFYKKLFPIAKTEDKSIIKEQGAYLEKCLEQVIGLENIEKVKKNGNKADVKLEDGKLEELLYLISKSSKIPAKNSDILARSAFIMLNNYFEYLFSDLLNYHFQKNADLISNKKISISINELQNYSSIDEAKEELIIKEVEALLIEMNFEELKSYFKDKQHINLEEEIVNWELINEIRERRHIIVHNNSIINQKYINRSNNQFKLKVGSEVGIDFDYFFKSLKELKLAGLLLIYNCWGSWDKEDAHYAIEEILNLTFDLLKTSDFEMVCKICDYVDKNIKSRNDEDEDILVRIKFNHCIALKAMKNKEKLTNKLKSIKTGTMSPIFKVAHLLMNDKHQESLDLLYKAKFVDELTLEKYLDWPLFTELRDNPEFDKKAREILI